MFVLEIPGGQHCQAGIEMDPTGCSAESKKFVMDAFLSAHDMTSFGRAVAYESVP